MIVERMRADGDARAGDKRLKDFTEHLIGDPRQRANMARLYGLMPALAEGAIFSSNDGRLTAIYRSRRFDLLVPEGNPRNCSEPVRETGRTEQYDQRGRLLKLDAGLDNELARSRMTAPHS